MSFTMSRLTHLSGCSLSKIRQAIGTAGDDLIQKIRRGVEEYLEMLSEEEDDDEDEEYEDLIRGTADVIVAKLKGQPAADLDDEGDAGSLAATILLKHMDGDSRPRTRFEVKHAFWFELSHNYAREMGPDAELFRYLEEGRPLFGRTTNGESIYAWFDRDEAVRLRDAARRIGASWREKAAKRVTPLWRDESAVKVLTDEYEGLAGCIDQILAAGYDVWAETA